MDCLSTKPEFENKGKEDGIIRMHALFISNGPIVPSLYILNRTFRVDYIWSSHTYSFHEYRN